MTLDERIPTFAELTAFHDVRKTTSSGPYSAARSQAVRPTPLDRDVFNYRFQMYLNRRQWLARSKADFASLSEAYHAGKLHLRFDLSLVYDPIDAKFASDNGIDYLGACLLFNERPHMIPSRPGHSTEEVVKGNVRSLLKNMVRIQARFSSAA